MQRGQHVVLRGTKENPLSKDMDGARPIFVGFARSGTARVQLNDGRVVVVLVANIADY